MTTEFDDARRNYTQALEAWLWNEREINLTKQRLDTLEENRPALQLAYHNARDWFLDIASKEA